MKKTPSYGIIKKTIGGIFMPREYRHIKQYEKEIFSLKEQGLTHREIGERLGFSREKIEDFLDDTTVIRKRYHQEYQLSR